MGQSLGKEDLEESKEQFYKKYQLLEEKQDEHYGNIKVFEKNYDAEESDKSQQQSTEDAKGNKKQAGKTRLYQKARTLAVKESVYQESDTLEKDLANMKQLISMTEENHIQKRTYNLIDIYEYFIQTEEKFCSSVQRIQLVMEYLQRDIQIEVKTKKLQNQRFTPQEIFTIAFSCINSLQNLQQFGLAHGDLKTSNILVSEYFEIKLLHPSVNRIVPAFATMIAQLTCGENVDSSGIYLSPALTKAVFQKSYQPQHNPFKSDVFTLGIILIECCNLGAVDNLYNYETGDFNENQLKIHMSIIKNQYGIDVHDLIARMIKIQEQDRPDFLELATQLNITNHMNEVYNQQQQMIEQQSSLQFAPDKYGVSLFKALNTEAEEYNYNQKQNSVHNSQVQNNQSLTAASSVHNNPTTPNNIASSQHPSFGVQSSHSFSQQQNPQGGLPSGLPLYGGGNIANSEIPPANPNSQSKPNAFFPQQQQVQQQGGIQLSQPLAQSQAQTSLLQPPIPPANPKSLSRQQSQDKLQQQGPHNFTNINTSQLNGVTFVKNSGQFTPSSLGNQQTQFNQAPPTLSSNNSQQQYPNSLSYAPNSNTQNTSNPTYAQQNAQNITPIQPNYLGNAQIQSIPIQQAYQQTSNQQFGGQSNLPSYPQQFKIQPNNQPITQLGGYQGYQDVGAPLYDPSKQTGINLLQNQMNIQNQFVNPQQQAGNYQIPEDVQKIINEFKEKQKQNDMLYSEKEKLSQSNVKYSVVPKQDSPLKMDMLSNRSVQNISPQQNNASLGYPGGVLGVEQRQPNELLQSLQQVQPNPYYQQPQQQQQQNQIAQQLIGYNQQQPQLQQQQSLYQNSPMINSQVQVQQLIGQVPNQNPYLQRNPSQYEQSQIPQQQQGLQTNQIGVMPYNPMIQQSYNFTAPNVLPQQQGVIGSNVFNSNDSQRSNKYEHIHETYDDQSHYIGEKIGGLRQGTGKFFYADGGYYEGEWCEGRMEGLGTLYYPSGSLAYLGQWRNDQFNGKGTVYNESPSQIIGEFDFTNFDNLGEYWVKYEGDFKDDNKEGIGTIYLSNGDRFTGNFNNDFVHGQGTYFRENKNPVSGVWDCNHLISYL